MTPSSPSSWSSTVASLRNRRLFDLSPAPLIATVRLERRSEMAVAIDTDAAAVTGNRHVRDQGSHERVLGLLYDTL